MILLAHFAQKSHPTQHHKIKKDTPQRSPEGSIPGEYWGVQKR